MATSYFAHCWGVFEGGGVRAAAHAGAFAAAKSAGVTFGRVAGTSGGSIVAALVAAGATPQVLTEELGKV
ncbi:MAG: patatin-like phospholipase family protein [Rubrivivax sp.]|nr:patatin-like phospholipase family protein [Rubrivivax sp.]